MPYEAAFNSPYGTSAVTSMWVTQKGLCGKVYTGLNFCPEITTRPDKVTCEDCRKTGSFLDMLKKDPFLAAELAIEDQFNTE